MDYFSFLLSITKAPITPGIQAHNVSIVTMAIEPQPLSNTARGGNIMHNSTLKQDIIQLY